MAETLVRDVDRPRSPSERTLALDALIDRLQRNHSEEDEVLEYQGIGNKGCQRLAAVLKNNTSMKRLVLKDCSIRAAGAKAIAEGLRHNRSLVELSLESNAIGPEGALDIASMLKRNRTLRVLDLSKNFIEPDGAKGIAAALEFSRLRSLRLERNDILYGGAKAIAAALRKNTLLEELDLRDNKLDDEAVSVVADAVRGHPSLRDVMLKRNQVSPDAQAAMASALARNRNILHRALISPWLARLQAGVPPTGTLFHLVSLIGEFVMLAAVPFLVAEFEWQAGSEVDVFHTTPRFINDAFFPAAAFHNRVFGALAVSVLMGMAYLPARLSTIQAVIQRVDLRAISRYLELLRPSGALVDHYPAGVLIGITRLLTGTTLWCLFWLANWAGSTVMFMPLARILIAGIVCNPATPAADPSTALQTCDLSAFTSFLCLVALVLVFFIALRLAPLQGSINYAYEVEQVKLRYDSTFVDGARHFAFPFVHWGRDHGAVPERLMFSPGHTIHFRVLLFLKLMLVLLTSFEIEAIVAASVVLTCAVTTTVALWMFPPYKRATTNRLKTSVYLGFTWTSIEVLAAVVSGTAEPVLIVGLIIIPSLYSLLVLCAPRIGTFNPEMDDEDSLAADAGDDRRLNHDTSVAYSSYAEEKLYMSIPGPTERHYNRETQLQHSPPPPEPRSPAPPVLDPVPTEAVDQAMDTPGSARSQRPSNQPQPAVHRSTGSRSSSRRSQGSRKRHKRAPQPES